MTMRLCSATPCPVPLAKAISAALRELTAVGFSQLTLVQYRADWRSLLVFARKRSFPLVFSDGLMKSFLRARGIRLRTKPKNKRQQRLLTHVRRLQEFSRDGRFTFRRGRKRRAPLPPVFEGIVEKYVRFLLEHRGVRRTSLRPWVYNVRDFLLFIVRRGVRSPSRLRSKLFSDFLVTKIHHQPSTVAGIAAHLRGFLRYLCMKGITAEDLSPHVPRIRMWRHDRLPAVWTTEQVEAMLAVIDRGSPVGKRNFAIVLLACRLGLRTCDIRGLRLEDIRWDEAKIAIRQSKTGVPLILPLSEEVGQALIDYLKHGRPDSEHGQVFLGAHAPFAPFGHSYNFHTILTAYRRLAGIKVPREGHWGMHSLRHTLATRLLQGGTPLPVISDILGHRSIDSTQIYTKVDISSLRDAALDVEEVLRG